MKFFYFILKPFLGKKSLVKFWEKVHLAALLGMGCGTGSVVGEESGERKVLSYVKTHLAKKKYLIFDVGGNEGQYSTAIYNNFDKNTVSVHTFEPSKNNFLILKENTKEFDNIVLNNFGLSNEITSATLYSTEVNSGLSSLYKRDLSQFNIELNSSETVELDTLDNYCRKNSIKEIDLLKIDIEGNEMKALIGSQKMLKKKKINSIQIEFGGTNIDSKTFLRDFWDLLHKDYKMYRIMKNGLYEVTEYKETLEIFFCTNYFFVLRKNK